METGKIAGKIAGKSRGRSYFAVTFGDTRAARLLPPALRPAQHGGVRDPETEHGLGCREAVPVERQTRDRSSRATHFSVAPIRL
jgi:hypothetical protein